MNHRCLTCGGRVMVLEAELKCLNCGRASSAVPPKPERTVNPNRVRWLVRIEIEAEDTWGDGRAMEGGDVEPLVRFLMASEAESAGLRVSLEQVAVYELEVVR